MGEIKMIFLPSLEIFNMFWPKRFSIHLYKEQLKYCTSTGPAEILHP